MRIMIYVLFVAVHFGAVVLDVVLVFVVVHLICGRRQTWKPLMALNRAGRPLVRHVENIMRRWWNHTHPARQITARKQLYLAVVVICAARLLICLVWTLVAKT